MLLNLNLEQQAAKLAIEGNWVILAGPGSGKTAVLLERHMEMLTRGIQPSQILNLTFTHEAATQMVERVGLFNVDQVFRTFHSFALDLLQRERLYLPFPVSEKIIPFYGQDFKLLKDLQNIYPIIKSSRTLKEKLDCWKCSNIEPDQALELTYGLKNTEYFYACAYKDYEKKCREQGWLDFNSLMKETVKLLETNDEVRRRNQRKYIAVDECQDTDIVQFRLLQLIYDGNIYVVGDENQCIYTWRSAQPGNLSNFNQVFSGSQTLYLGQNYRSTQALVEFFKKILPVDNGIASHMQSEREIGQPPTITHYADEYEEAFVTLEKIRKLSDIKNTAVIARTNRQLYLIQKRCISAGIKSKIVGAKDFWQRNEIKHLVELAKEKINDPRDAASVLSDLIQKNDLIHIYRNSGQLNEGDPVENLNDFVKMARNKGNLQNFLDWLRRFTYARASEKNPIPILALTTVHQAKGKEWKHVFVIGAKQGLMPHKDGDILEEHRIFFVACSRAADTLDISFYDNHSEFLNQFQEDFEYYDVLSSEGI